MAVILRFRCRMATRRERERGVRELKIVDNESSLVCAFEQRVLVKSFGGDVCDIAL